MMPSFYVRARLHIPMGLISRFLILVLLLCIGRFTHANVISSRGSISFDINADGASEMTVNHSGLGVGVAPSANLHVAGNAIISDRLSVGMNHSSSNLNIGGSLGFSFETFDSSITLTEHSVVFADSSAGNITMTLPDISTAGEGRMIWIKKVSSDNEVTVAGGGAGIDGQSRVLLASGGMGSMKLVSAGSEWLLLSVSGNGPAPPVVVYEPFDYTVGQNLNGNNLAGSGNLDLGTGWDGAWYAETDSDLGGDANFHIQSGLSFTNLPTLGGSIERTVNSRNRAIARRALSDEAKADLLNDNSTIWFSCLYKDGGNGEDFAMILGDSSLGLVHNQEPRMSSSGNAFGFIAEDTYIHGLMYENSNLKSAYAGNIVTANGSTTLLAGKINWKPDGTPDEFYLFNISDPLNAEPAEGTAFATYTADFKQSEFSTLSMWDRDIHTGQIDEICIAATYAEAMGQDR